MSDDNELSVIENIAFSQCNNLEAILKTIEGKRPELVAKVEQLIDEGKVEAVYRIVEKAISSLEKTKKMIGPAKVDEVAVISYEVKPDAQKVRRIKEDSNKEAD